MLGCEEGGPLADSGAPRSYRGVGHCHGEVARMRLDLRVGMTWTALCTTSLWARHRMRWRCNPEGQFPKWPQAIN